METFAIISVCVLASLAGAFAVVWSTTSTLDTRMKALESSQSSVRNWLKSANATIETLRRGVESSTNHSLKAAVDDLAAAVDADRARNRKEFGRLWQRQRAAVDTPAAEGEVDPELQAMIDLQRANGAGAG